MTKQQENGGAIKRDRNTIVAALQVPGIRLKSLRFSLFAAVALSSLALSGCVSTTENQIYGYSPTQPVPTETVAAADENLQSTVVAEGSDEDAETNTPEGTAEAAIEVAANDQTLTAMAPAQTTQPSVDALNVGITQNSTANPGGNLYTLQQPSAESTASVPVPVEAPRSQAAPIQEMAVNAPISAADTTAAPVAETTAAEPLVEPAVEATRAVALAEPTAKKSIFSRFFNASPTPPKNVPRATKPAVRNSLRSDIRIARASAGSTDGLPGVRMSSLFDIKTGNDEDGEDASGVEVASAAGLARLAPRGLHIQTERVDVACLKPQLIGMIKKIEKHYGRPAVITSGYRNPKHNRKIGGARNSRHTSCEAADIQIDGVSKWELATYLRSMPGRGGVGTYCHTKSVHLDIGTERDWNWRCRRRKK